MISCRIKQVIKQAFLCRIKQTIKQGGIMFNLTESIKQDEGYRLLPYRDSNDILTIGYGHNLSMGITSKEANMLLEYDIQNSKNEIANSLSWILKIVPVEKYEALVELTFWIGIDGVLGFKKMLSALYRKEWTEAANQLMNSQLGKNFHNRSAKLAKIIGE